eukprot:6193666-Pleurochrysis_carterae.AAC.1
MQRRIRGFLARRSFVKATRAARVLHTRAVAYLRRKAEKQAAVRIQSRVRQVLCRLKLLVAVSAALRIQTAARRSAAVSIVSKLRRERHEMNASILLQTHVRRNLASRELRRRQVEKQRFIAARQLQARARTHAAMRSLAAASAAVIGMQSIVRRMVALLALRKHVRAATVIETRWREVSQRRRFLRFVNASICIGASCRRMIATRFRKLALRAALRLQTAVRRRRALHAFWLQKRSAVRIEAVQRARTARERS